MGSEMCIRDRLVREYKWWGVRGTYIEAVGDDFHGDALEVGEGLDFGEPKRLMRLDEAEEVLHLCSVTRRVCDGEHKGSLWR